MFLSPESITKPLLIQAGFVVGTILTIVYVYRRFLRERSFHPDFPVVRLTENGDTAREWLTDMKSILDKGMRLTDGPFQVTSAFGPLVRAIAMRLFSMKLTLATDSPTYPVRSRTPQGFPIESHQGCSAGFFHRLSWL